MDKEVIKEMFQAVKDDDVEKLEKIISENASLLDYKFVGGAGLLHKAAMYDSVSVIHWLLSIGICVDIENDDRDTPLYFSLDQGNVKAARELLGNGADVNFGAGWRATPLISAIYSGNLDAVKLLIEKGANINQSYGEPAQNPLDFTLMQNQGGIADYLLSCGAESINNNEVIELSIEEHIKLGFDELVLLDTPHKGSLKIYLAPPSETRDCNTIVTVGMSDTAMNVPEGFEDYRYAELMMNLPKDWPLSGDALTNEEYNWPVVWLEKIATYPFRNDVYFGKEFSIIENEVTLNKIASSVSYTCFLLTLPKMDFYRPTLSNGKRVNIYTVFPIYTEEKEYEEKEGVLSLLNRFQELEIDNVVRSNRKNVGVA